MKISDVQKFTDKLLPKLFSFSYALAPDNEKARGLMEDAYAIFLIREKNYIEKAIYPKQKNEERLFIKFFLLGIMHEIFNLSLKNLFKIKTIENSVGHEYKSFYSIELKQRAVLFLKEKFSFKIEYISSVTSLSKSEIIQSLYNSREILLYDGNEIIGARHERH